MNGPGAAPVPFFVLLVREWHERRLERQMTIKFSAGDEPPVDLLAAAEGLYRDIAEELTRTLKAVRDGQTADIRAATAVVKDLKQAFQVAMDERTRVDKLRKHASGIAPGGTLDFDAARDEIGRRLACLRDAESGG